MSLRRHARPLAALAVAAASLYALRCEAPVAFQYRWPVGTQYVYALRWTRADASTTGSGASAGARRAAFDIDGELVLRSLGQSGELHHFAARVGHLVRHRVEADGRELLADDRAAAAMFEGREAVVEVQADGAVRSVYFQPADPELFQDVMEGLLTEAEVVLPATGQRTWSTREPGALGDADVRYVADVRRAQSLSRTRTAYRTLAPLGARPLDAGVRQQLASDGRVELAPAGHLRRLDQREVLTVVDADGRPLVASCGRLELELRDVAHVDASPSPLSLGHLTERRPGRRFAADAPALPANAVAAMAVPF